MWLPYGCLLTLFILWAHLIFSVNVVEQFLVVEGSQIAEFDVKGTTYAPEGHVL